MLRIAIGIILCLGSFACDDKESRDSATDVEVLSIWKAAGIENIEVTDSDEASGIGSGDCMQGKAAGLHLQLCTFKDALAADSAKDEGIASIGANTGTALVRDRYLLVLADIDKVDVHGKTLNKMAKMFLAP